MKPAAVTDVNYVPPPFRNMFQDIRNFVELTQSLEAVKQLVAPEDACQAGMDAVKHASGAADSEMPAGFCACPRIYVVRDQPPPDTACDRLCRKRKACMLSQRFVCFIASPQCVIHPKQDANCLTILA